jgi:peptidoglycan/LPS O-acetylase OafA/YrhL
MSVRSYRPDIDGLRSIAVLSVLFFHLDLHVFSGGFVGVDVFFVISGYLITGIIVSELENTGKFSFSNFYIRRLRRLFPAFLTVLTFTTIACLLIFAPGDLQRYGAALFHSIFSLSNIYFWSEAGYFDTNSKLNPLLHTWSLSVEEQFYMFWPALAAFLFARGGMRIVALAIVLLSTASLILNLLFDQNVIQYFWPDTSNDRLDNLRAAMFFLTPFRIFELGIGAMLVFLMKHKSTNNLKNELIFFVGLAMVLLPIFIYTEETVFPSYNALLPCVGTALIIFANNPVYLGAILRNKLAVGIGLISYSLYLVHWPLIVLYKYWKLDELNLTEQMGIAVLSVVCSILIYKFIEQPYRRPINSTSIALPNARFATTIGILSSVFLIAGTNMLGSRGWEWRLNEKKQAIFAQISNPADFHLNYYGGANCKPSEYCVVNKDQGPNVFFIGDSHSQQYAYGLANTFENYQFTHIDNRCRFNTLNYCYPGKFQDSKFFDLKRESLEQLKNSSDPIIIGQNWGDKRPYFDEVTKEIIKFDNQKTYVKFIAEQLVIMNEFLGGNRLLVTGQINKFGELGDPLSCLGRPFGSAQCSASPESYATEFNRLLNRELKKAGIPFINPTRVKCKKETGCVNLNSAGMPLYSDPGHLSTWGSLYTVRRLRKQITEFLDQTT